MAKTNDFNLCQQYLLNYIETIKKQINIYRMEVNQQKQSCPIEDLTITQIDHGPKESLDTKIYINEK